MDAVQNDMASLRRRTHGLIQMIADMSEVSAISSRCIEDHIAGVRYSDLGEYENAVANLVQSVLQLNAHSRETLVSASKLREKLSTQLINNDGDSKLISKAVCGIQL